MVDGPGKWTHGANAIAAVTTAGVAAVGLVVALWPASKNAEKPAPAATITPAPSPSPTLRVPSVRPITLEPVSASLAFTGEADRDGARPVQAIVTLRIRNDGAAPYRLAWLDARRGSSLDLGGGIRIAGSRETSVSGLPDCAHDRPGDCDAGDMVTLVPTQDQLATVTLTGTLDKDAAGRVGTAQVATFIGRLAVRPAQGDPYVSPVSVEKIPLANNAR